MKQNLLKRFLFSKLFNTLAIVVLVLLATAITRAYIQKNQVNKEVAALRQEITKLEQGNQELGSLLDYLQTTRFLETEARSRFGLAREGERAVVIVQPNSADKEEPNKDQERENLSEDLPNPWRWWYYFLGPKKNLESSTR